MYIYISTRYLYLPDFRVSNSVLLLLSALALSFSMQAIMALSIRLGSWLPRNVVPRHLWANPWWRHQMETFSALLALCAGNSPVIGEFPAQRPATRSFDTSFGLRLNTRLSKQSRSWCFEIPSSSLWLHCNVFMIKFEACIDSRPAVLRLRPFRLWNKPFGSG